MAGLALSLKHPPFAADDLLESRFTGLFPTDENNDGKLVEKATAVILRLKRLKDEVQNLVIPHFLCNPVGLSPQSNPKEHKWAEPITGRRVEKTPEHVAFMFCPGWRLICCSLFSVLHAFIVTVSLSLS